VRNPNPRSDPAGDLNETVGPSIMNDPLSDERRIEKNVAGGFDGIVTRIASSSRPREEVEGKILVAYETWKAGKYNLTISLLLDAIICMRVGMERN
jgi:hypothetical protein